MLKTITPIDNSTYVERNYATANEINNALDISKNISSVWKNKSINERKKILIKFVDSFLQNRTEIEEQLCNKWEDP